jgi:mannosyltransferase
MYSSLALDCIIFGLQRFGGISNYWKRLTEHAVDMDRASVELILPRHLLYRELDPHRVDRAATRRERLPAPISRYLPVQAPSSAVFHTSYYRRPRGRVERYIVTAYDFTYERYRTGAARWVHHHQKTSSIRRADAVICISDFTRRDVLDHCPGADPRRVHVIPLGIDRAAFFPERGESEPEQRLLLFVGQRGGYKRFDLAVEAVRQSPDLVLGIAGPALTVQERGMLVDLLGTRWIPFESVTPAQLRRLYSSAFAFVFPSDCEGFGLPILEAMACGCPVIASGAGSLPEVGGGAALYAAEQRPEAYAAAIASLGNADVRRQCVESGLARCAEFSWDRTLSETFAIYAGESLRASALALRT